MTRSKSAKLKALVLLGIFATTGMAMAKVPSGMPIGYAITGTGTGCQAYTGSMRPNWYLLEPNNGTNLSIVTTCVYAGLLGPYIGSSTACTSVLNGNCCTIVDTTCPIYRCPPTPPTPGTSV